MTTAHSTVTSARQAVKIAPAATPSGGGRKLALNALSLGLANIFKIGLNLLMLPLMAHLLGPTEFGLYALALPTIAFCMILADGGLAASLAREPLESRLVWSSGFWLVLGVGVALALTTMAAGAVLAIVTRQPRVSGLMDVLSLSLVAIALAALPSARLTREMRLSIFALADLSSSLCGAIVAVALALGGFGAMSLAAQYVVYSAFRSAVLNAVAFVRPRWEFDLSALRGHLSTGSALLGVKMSDFLGRIVENVLYGNIFGPAGLGVYTFANQAPRFITEAASGPTWAVLYAFAVREPRERWEPMHLALLRLLASLVFGAAALLSATAPPLLALVLGVKWSQAGELLRLLVPFYALGAVSAQSGAIMLARNRGWLWFWCAAGLAAGRVAAVWLGSWTGQVGVALGVGAALALNAFAMFGATGHAGGARPLIGAVAPAAGAAVLAGLAAYAALPAGDVGVLGLAQAWSCGGVVYLAALAALGWRGLAKDWRAAVSQFRGAKGRRA